MKTIKATLIALILLTPFTASADFIQGEISLIGVADVKCADDVLTEDCTFGSTTGIKFLFGWVGITDGDFGAIAVGTPVSFTSDFFFAPFSIVGPLWSVGGFDFALEQVSVVTHTNTLLSLSGRGTVSKDGYLDTEGNWSFTGTGLGQNTFVWANEVVVPEPGTLALLGLGLLGIGASRRRKSL